MKRVLVYSSILVVGIWLVWSVVPIPSTFIVAVRRVVTPRQLVSEWYAQEEAKIQAARATLRQLGKWDERWDESSMLGTYGWRGNMDCGDATYIAPCMAGGYTFSQDALEKLKRGDMSHNPRNTAQESFVSQQQMIQQQRLMRHR